MTTFSEPNRLGDVLKREFDPFYNRETASITGGSNLAIGTLVSKVGSSSGTATATANGGNTGNGAMGSITVGTGAIDGTYTLTITSAAADAGGFTLADPNGSTVGTGDVGSAFDAGGLTFTLADGSTDFAEGDSFTIAVVSDQAGQYTEYTNGTAAGVLLEAADASAADVQAVILARGPAVVARGKLVGLDTAGEADLAALGIIVRDEVDGGPVAIA